MHLQQQIDLLPAGHEKPGPWRAFGDFFQASVHVIGGTAQLEASNDFSEITNIDDWGGELAAGIHAVEGGPRWIRVASGTATQVILQARG